MEIFNRNNTNKTGNLEILKSHMLIGRQNVANANISMQISTIPAGSEQPVHKHEPEQCYYIIKGKGLMIIEDEERVVVVGDAIYVPSNKRHGLKNIGDIELEYLTSNTPPFDENYENELWPSKPGNNLDANEK